MGRTVVVALLAGLLGAARAQAVQFIDGEVTASAEPTFTGTPSAGCAPVWVELELHGARPLELEVRFRSYSGDGTVTRQVRLDPGEKRVVSLPVPTVLRVGELEIWRKNERLAGTLAVNLRAAQGQAVMVMGASSRWDDLAGRVESGRRDPPVFVEPRNAPDLLAGYVGWSAVVLLEDGSRLSPPARAALEGYVRAGGQVVFAGEAAEQPYLERWRAQGSLDEPVTLGLGQLSACRAFSACLALLQAPVRAVRAEGDEDGRGGQYASGGHGTLLPEVGQTPVGAFLIIILLFAIAIGPVNFAVASRYGRHLMLLTIPALAATTCAGIATYGVASDGLFSKHFAAVSLTSLDADAHEAATLSVTGNFAALSPGSVTFPAGTALVLPTDKLGGLGLDWSNGTTFRGDFLPSRTYRERAFVQVAPSRARVGFHGLQVENALGAKAIRIVVRSGGRLLEARSVADGAAAPVSPVAPDELAWTLRAALESRFTVPLLDAALAPPGEGEFVAEIEGGPFAPDGGLQPTVHRVAGVVRGKVTP